MELFFALLVAGGVVVGAFIGYILGRKAAVVKEPHNDTRTLNQVKIALIRSGLDLEDVNRAINRMEMSGIIFLTKRSF